VLNFLQQPFPFLHKRKYLLFWVLELLILVTLFEYFVEPFTRTYSEHKYPYIIICLFHATEVTLVYLIVFVVVQYSKHKAKWRYIDEAKYVALMLFLIGLGNFFIRDLIYNADNWRWIIFWEEMAHGWIAGGLFYLLVINLNKMILKRTATGSSNEPVSKIKISSPVASDSFQVDPKEVIAIKADGNYVIFYCENEEKMIRQTLDNIESQLKDHQQIIRTHRAYLVNTRHIVNASGNSAGYQLTLENLDFRVPVSRSKTETYLAAISED
jgi:hypothetical protein